MIEELDDILVKNRNDKWIGYRSSLLKPDAVLQITYLEDVVVCYQWIMSFASE